ncbi:hypothetical protein [Singulisphaera sp. PoT]|uniref:hypothetical protein n=1 Tax=Singulisphaera sp. PoT TaxID=3411797 RepID=UPI003BF528C4
MSRIRFAILASLIAFCPGCILFSVEPLATPGNSAEDTRLLGTWEKISGKFADNGRFVYDVAFANEVWTISKQGKEPGSPLNIKTGSSSSAKLETARLSFIGDWLYLDFMVEIEEGVKKRKLYLFARAEFHGNYVILQHLDSEKLQKLLKEKPNVLKGYDQHETSDGTLKSSTKDLREFFREYGDSVFIRSVVLKRVVYGSPQQP